MHASAIEDLYLLTCNENVTDEISRSTCAVMVKRLDRVETKIETNNWEQDYGE